jgi:O-6-methylguanine DNA methyltransferase
MKLPQNNSALEVPTEAGTFLAVYSRAGLCELRFPEKADSPPLADAATLLVSMEDWHAVTSKALRRLLAGCRPEIFPPMDLSAGSDFQKKVWAAMREIPFGETVSYQELATRIGNPQACRAVGGACGANPIPVLIPCHRVLAANRGLGGFSGGLDWKKRLLALEGSWTPKLQAAIETTV